MAADDIRLSARILQNDMAVGLYVAASRCENTRVIF
jgi:hypothetical protein